MLQYDLKQIAKKTKNGICFCLPLVLLLLLLLLTEICIILKVYSFTRIRSLHQRLLPFGVVHEEKNLHRPWWSPGCYASNLGSNP